LVTLQQINGYTDANGVDTATAHWPSPLAGDTVRVQASVLVTPIISPLGDRRTIFYYATAWGCWVEDPTGSPWSGLEIYQADSNATGTFFDLCDTASTYEFTGIVTPYGVTTEFALITSPTPIPTNLISQETKRPDPIPLTLDSCWDSQGHFNLKLRKYEGMYVSFVADSTHPLTTSNLITGNGATAGGFTINGNAGQKISMYAQSKYYRTGTAYTLRPSYKAPVNGSKLPYVRGVLEAYDPAAGWTWEIVPMYPGDLGEPTMSPPYFYSCTRDKGIVPFDSSVNVSCVVAGLVGATVTNVTLFSRVNGVDNPATAMTKVGNGNDSTYTGVIPAVTTGDSSYVEYYCMASDNNSQSSTYPSNVATSRFAYFVFSDNRPLTIQHVRYNPLGSGYSAYNGYPVTVTGVVTADTSNIPGGGTDPTRVYIQNGTTPWSGIILGFKGTINISDEYALKQGDLITVTGTPVLSSSTGTRLDTLTFLSVISHNNPLPAAHAMKTSDVGYKALGDTVAEPWDGCIVTYNHVKIDSANADGPTYNYGESYGYDTTATGNHTRINWSDGRTRFYAGAAAVKVNKGDYFESITGILGYTFTNYKLCPRNDSDIVGYVNVLTSVKGDKNVIPTAYSLKQNFPNPFNPSTIISYDLPKSGLVTLKIYNILGQQVRTLVNESQNAGTHKISFNASSLTSGVYFYSLTSGSFSQVKKMMLIK